MTEASAEIASFIASATTLDEVNAQFEQWKANTSIYDRIGDVLFVTTALADMAGQLMIAGREAQVVKLAATPPRPPLPKPFLDLPWAEAIEFFKRRGLVRPSDFETLLVGYAQRSTVARQLMLDQIQTETMRHLSDAIEQGESLPDFAGKMNELTTSLGLAPAKPSYLQMVFRTNVQSAYGAGRYKAINNPVVRKSRPYVQYRTVGDPRVREEHQVLEGKTYAIDDPVWQRISPPNGYNCRCSMVTLSKAEAQGVEISTEIPDGYRATPGFDQAPTAVLDVSDTDDVEAEPDVG